MSAQLRNELQNVGNLENLLRLFQNFKEGGDVTQLQVDQVEQQLLNSRNSVLQRQLNLRDSLDQFKLQLGLPVNIALELDDGVLRPISEQMDRYQTLTNEFEAARQEVLQFENRAGEINLLRERILRIFTTSVIVRRTNFAKTIAERWKKWADLPSEAGNNKLGEQISTLGEERRQLLALQTDLEEKGQTLSETDRKRLARLNSELDLAQFESSLRAYELQPWKQIQNPQLRDRLESAAFLDMVTNFSLVLSEARNERLELLRRTWPELPSVRIGDQDLLKVGLDEAQNAVAQAAVLNRLDLMNARAQLVDAWRQIAISANALLGTFNVQYHLDSSTPAGEARPFALGGSRNRHQLIFNTELPLVRKLERNEYRAALIGFQRQRRFLMAAEDRVVSDVRAELRLLRVLQENYKIQQRLVELAYYQVETALDEFQAPAVPGGAAGGGRSGSAAALTQQLLNAQSRLLNTQNQLFNFWISFQIARMQLFRDLELMPIDPRGVWNDESTACEQPDNPANGTQSGERPAAPGAPRGADQLARPHTTAGP